MVPMMLKSTSVAMVRPGSSVGMMLPRPCVGLFSAVVVVVVASSEIGGVLGLGDCEGEGGEEGEKPEFGDHGDGDGVGGVLRSGCLLSMG